MVLSALLSIECKQPKCIYTCEYVCVFVRMEKNPLVNSRQILHFSVGVFIFDIYVAMVWYGIA